MKWCSRCEDMRPDSEFRADRTRHSGVASYCRPCAKEYNAQYNAKNAERIKKRRAAYYRAHGSPPMTEEKKAKARKRYHENRDRYAASGAAWKRRNPERIRVYNQRRLALVSAAAGSHSDEEWEEMLFLAGHKCLRCLGSGPEKDHIVPLSLGGSHHISNIQPLCRRCNSVKRSAVIDYRGSWRDTWST